jgi:hypothetical protein
MPQITGLLAEETIPKASPIVVNPATGKLRLASSTRGFMGWSAVDAQADEACTVIVGPGYRMGLTDSGLAAGTALYLSATAGALDTTVAGSPVAVVINATDVSSLAAFVTPA